MEEENKSILWALLKQVCLYALYVLYYFGASYIVYHFVANSLLYRNHGAGFSKFRLYETL